MTRTLKNSRLVVAATAALAGAGCAGAGRGDIDRTQPDKVDKTFFLNADGTPKVFYFRMTITDVPPTNGWAFEGMQGPMDKVKFVITEDQLIGTRAYDYAPGSENAIQGGANNTDAPVVSYKIKSHFDVKREYNAGTGEQTNVISENTTDRPWDERQYMRVDWATDKLSNPFMDVTMQIPSTGSYEVSETELTNPARAIYTKDYIDVSVQVQATPDYNACLKLFAAPDEGYVWDCGPANITLRESIMAANPNSEYEPLDYPDREPLVDAKGQPISVYWASDGPHPCNATNLSNGAGGAYTAADCTQVGADRFAKFGFFRTIRQTYDPREGSTEQGRKYLANRWNIWDKTIQRDGNGTPALNPDGSMARIPDNLRDTRVVPYYTNVQFPDDDPLLMQAAQQVVGDWNDAMKRTVAGVRATANGAEVTEPSVVAAAAALPDIIVLKPNSCSVAGVQTFLQGHPTLGDEVQKATQLDVTKIDKSNLVQTCTAMEALTQTLPDGDAGKFTWQRNGNLRYSFLHWVDRPQGASSAPLGYGPSSADPETGEIISASAYLYGAALNTYTQFAADSVDIANGNLTTEDLLSGKRISDVLKETSVNRQARDALVIPDEAKQYAHILASAGGIPGATTGMSAPAIGSAGAVAGGVPRLIKSDPVAMDLKLATIKGTQAEALLMTDDILAAFVPNYIPGRTALSDIDPATLAQASPVNWMSQAARQAKRDRFQKLAMNGCLYTADFADDAIMGTALKLANLSGDALFKTLRAQIFRGLTDHEMGHTMGLRHNFAGSTDALNYGNQYWTIRTSIDKAQWSANSLEEHMYSTVMDYGARFNTDVNGLGRYDYAAIRFGYGQLTDIMPNATESAFTLSNDIAVRDYTTIPTMVGGVANVEETHIVRNAAVESALRVGFSNLATNGGSFGIMPERPYKFCSDEFEGNLDCKTWDMGASQQEIINNIIDLYKNYYVFNAYQRGRVSWSINGYLDRLLNRYFNRYSEAFQFYYFFNNSLYGTYLADDLLGASILSLNALGEVLQTPEPGKHCTTATQPNVLVVAGGTGDGTCLNGAPQPDIGLPDGKPYYIDFSNDYYYRVTRAGSVYEKLAALIALSSTSSMFFRIDTLAGQDLFSINYYRLFKDQMLNLFSGVIRNDPSTYGGYAPAGVYTPTPVVDPSIFGRATYTMPTYMLPTTPRVDTPDSKTIQRYALLVGLAELDTTWDATLDFSNYANVSVKGSNDDVTYAPGTNVVEFSHPTSHITYRAGQVDPARPGIGVTLLQELNVLVGVAGTPGVLPAKYGLLNGTPLPDWQSAQVAVAAAQAKANADAASPDATLTKGDQDAYTLALQVFNYIDSLVNYRVDLIGDMRTFRHAFQN